MLYKLSKSVFPCMMLTLCIGFCYAFSLFTPHIAESIGYSVESVQFTFCLNIFFLGMGAAMFGPLAERRIKSAALLSASLLTVGLLLGGLACNLKSMWTMYLGCGVVAGLAEGIGYVTPNKNMLLWFPRSRFKGILSAVSIFSFGLGSTLCSWLFGLMFPSLGMERMFYALAGLYAIPSFLSAFLIDKPLYALLKLERRTESGFSYAETARDRFFQKSWVFMFLNISMGLVLIGSCATIMGDLGLSSTMVITIMMLCGIFNGLGRIVFPAIADLTGNKRVVWLLTILIEVILMIPVIYSYHTHSMILTAALCIVLIHACYGSAFACLPIVLAEHYGKDTLSQRHGFCLTSWGMASLMAYLCTTFVLKNFSGFGIVMGCVLVGYLINTFVAISICRSDKVS